VIKAIGDSFTAAENLKSEIRNKPQWPKHEGTKPNLLGSVRFVLNLPLGTLELVSDFGFRASDFGFERAVAALDHARALQRNAGQ
jgi:hypothetical protein